MYYSTLADDVEFVELVEQFVNDLPKRMQTLEEALAVENYELLRCVAHQLKGAFGSYGYQPLAEAACQLEQDLSGGKQFDAVRDQVTQLIFMCQNASAAPAPSAAC